MTYISEKIPEIIKSIFDVDMGIWTEVDAPGRVTIDYTDERIEIVDLDNDEEVYVYKATDALVEDFILDFEFQTLNTTTGIAAFGIGLADGVGTMKDVNNGLYVRVRYVAANNSQVEIHHMTGGIGVAGADIQNLADDTVYYGRLIRRGSYCWLGVYSDRIRETHATGSPVEYRDVTPAAFTHLYPMAAYDDGTAGRAMDAYVEAVKLISSPDIDKYLDDRSGTNSVLSGIDTKVDTVDGKVDTVQTDLDNATDGLGALKADIGTVDGKVDTVEAATSPAEIIEAIFDADMGDWTEVDGPGRVTIDYANERIAIADLDEDEDVYVYNATDANVDDFILDFEFKVLSTATAGSFGIGLADGIGTMEDVSNGLYVRIQRADVNNHRAIISHFTGGSMLTSKIIGGLLDDTTYYCRLIRRNSYCWMGVYSDRIRETHVAGSPSEYYDSTPVAFTHLYPMVAYDDGSPGRAIDAYVEGIKLISAPDIDKYLDDRSGTNSILSGIGTKVDTVDGKADTIKTQTDKLAGATPGIGSTTANYNAAEQDIVSIGANDTKNKLHSLLLDINALTAAATVTIRMYMQINGTERKVYDEDFVKGTDPDGLWIVNGTVGIHEVLRVAAQSDAAGDDGKAIKYDYMLEAM